VDDDLGDIIIAIVSMILAFGTTGERIRTDEREFLALFFVSCKHSRISQSTALRRRRWRNAAGEYLDLLAIRNISKGKFAGGHADLSRNGAVSASLYCHDNVNFRLH